MGRGQDATAEARWGNLATSAFLKEMSIEISHIWLIRGFRIAPRGQAQEYLNRPKDKTQA